MPRVLIVAVVVVATLAASVTALATFHAERELDVGRVRLSIQPGTAGALDLYVPLVDWGVRFPAVRLPARIHVDVRSVDRDAVVRLAAAGQLNAALVRARARDVLAGYLRLAIAFSVAMGLATGALVAVAIRGGRGPRLRTTLVAAGATSAAIGVALVVLLPPRGSVGAPQYYANGPEVPTALRALESLGASARTLEDEIDEQLVGIAQLVGAPADRAALRPGLPRVTIASDLHNNVIALPALERAARGGPLLFAGDLTDRGTPVEQSLVMRIARAGTRLVFVSGNHDSDVLERKLARAGAVVLTRRGRLRGDGTTDGRVVTPLAGLRIAGYDDPLERRAREHYRDNGADYSRAEQERFAAWLAPLRDRVDVVMVHAPGLAERALQKLRRERDDRRPLVFVVGHTHRAELRRRGSITVLNSGSIGGGGTGNLADGGGDIGLARLTYARTRSFRPRAADLVEIDPGSGAARARRVRLDEPCSPPACAG